MAGTRERAIAQQTEPLSRPPVVEARERLLADMPVRARQLDLAGMSTAVLEGGRGAPVILLHGPGGYAAHWTRVIPDLVRTHRVIAPDLPGHGGSEIAGEPPDAGRVLTWLGELIARTCTSTPVLVGEVLGGAIAARYAGAQGDRLRHLVLVDTLGLAPFRPAPEFGLALTAFLGDPNEETHDLLWQRCAFDLDRLRDRMGEGWDRIKAYNLDRARTPGLQAVQQGLMEQFGMPVIPSADLERISVPTTLIWGRHDLATSLAVAEAAAARYGWSLTVIEEAADAPPMEQPEAFLKALRAVLGSPGRREAALP